MDHGSLHNPVNAADMPALKCDAAVPGGLDDRHPVGRPVDVIGGKGEADDPSFSSFVNPCGADYSPELDTVDVLSVFHICIEFVRYCLAQNILLTIPISPSEGVPSKYGRNICVSASSALYPQLTSLAAISVCLTVTAVERSPLE